MIHRPAGYAVPGIRGIQGIGFFRAVQEAPALQDDLSGSILRNTFGIEEVPVQLHLYLWRNCACLMVESTIARGFASLVTS
jgi:hypothetical protein